MSDEICKEAIEAADEIDDLLEHERVAGCAEGRYTLMMAIIDEAIRKAKATPVQPAPGEDDVRVGAAKIWERIERFSEAMLGDGPLGVFKFAKNSEPTKTMLAQEKAFAVEQIAAYLRAQLAVPDGDAILHALGDVLLDEWGVMFSSSYMTRDDLAKAWTQALAALDGEKGK